jgi:hypothetical protein
VYRADDQICVKAETDLARSFVNHSTFSYGERHRVGELRTRHNYKYKLALHYESKVPVSRPQLPREIGTTFAEREAASGFIVGDIRHEK